jgi:hypothetical protein
LNLVTSRSRPTSTSSTLGGSSAWRVEYVDRGGHGYVAIFAGQSAELRARDYYDAIERGALNSRIADAELTTASALVSLPKKRRLMR